METFAWAFAHEPLPDNHAPLNYCYYPKVSMGGSFLLILCVSLILVANGGLRCNMFVSWIFKKDIYPNSSPY